MSFSGTSLVPLVVQAKHTELFQVSHATHLSVILDVFYSINFYTQAQCLILIISDGAYSIPVLVNPESVKDQFRLATLNSTTLNNLRHKVITMNQSAVSIYRRGNIVSPYIVVLDWQKAMDENVTIRPDIRDISKSPKVRRWIKIFDEFELPKDKPISSFFITPHIDRLFPSFDQVEYILEKILATCYFKGEWAVNRALSEQAIIKEETVGTGHQVDTTHSMGLEQEPMDTEESIKTKQPIHTDQASHSQQRARSSAVIYLDEMDKVEEPNKDVDINHSSALSTNNTESGTVTNDSKSNQTTLSEINHSDQTIVVPSIESNNVKTIANDVTTPLKRTISSPMDVPEKKVKSDHTPSVSLTDLSKEELKQEFNSQLNSLHSMANDTHMSTFGRISSLSKLRSLCYIRYCDS